VSRDRAELHNVSRVGAARVEKITRDYRFEPLRRDRPAQFAGHIQQGADKEHNLVVISEPIGWHTANGGWRQ
jgi:hypothetical protein